MALFTKTNTFEESNVTKSEALLIYELLKTKNESDIRRENNYRMFKIKQVIAEMKRIENEVNIKMSGNYLISEEEYHFNDEELKIIDKQAVYFVPTTLLKLIESVSSDILNVTAVISDIMKYKDSDINTIPSWNEFKEMF